MTKAPILCDVLVVGLGPAGASAATQAAQAGLEVLAIERNAEPGQPVQCAEFVPMMIDRSVMPVEDFVAQQIGFMDSYIQGEDRCETTENFRGHIIDRATFDRGLIETAMRAGAKIRFSSPLRKIDNQGSAVLANGDRIHAKVIVGADGPLSQCGKAIGKTNQDLVYTRQITTDLLQPHQGTDIFLAEEYLGGYGWMFPKQDKCHLGLGVVPHLKNELKPLLERLHARLVAEGRLGERIDHVTGGAIPVSGMVSPIGFVEEVPVILAGDAAGLTNPITGAGINAAVLSGKLAGDAAVDACRNDLEGLNDYRDELESLFGASLRHAVAKRQTLLREYNRSGRLTPNQIRHGWVAFPQYWDRPTDAQHPKIPLDRLSRNTA